MSKMYDNLISTAINSINIVENTVIITYNSNKDKEYTFNCQNVQQFEDSLCKELISVELKTGGSVGKFLHNQIKEGLLVESK
tara:strand:- start:108 stop:353 length:246 start_codon:yes stop_codon:yes gene_type:complete